MLWNEKDNNTSFVRLLQALGHCESSANGKIKGGLIVLLPGVEPLQFPAFPRQRRDSLLPVALSSLWGLREDPPWHPVKDGLSGNHEKTDARVCVATWWRKVRGSGAQERVEAGGGIERGN